MSWNNWKSWLLLAGVLVAVVAIYAFASPSAELTPSATEPRSTATATRAGIRTPVGSPSRKRATDIEPVREYRPALGRFETTRDLFAFVEPPPPPQPKPQAEPVAVAPTAPPPDSDKDTIPDFRDNCPDIYNPDQTDIDRNGVGAACQQGVEVAPPPPLPPFDYKYIGTFGSASNQLATFSRNGEVINVRVGETFGGKFILKNIGIESVDIGYVGRNEKTRIPIGQ